MRATEWALFAVCILAGTAMVTADTCNGAELPTLFPNINWPPLCLSPNTTWNATSEPVYTRQCQGDQSDLSSNCYGEWWATCFPGGVWQLTEQSSTTLLTTACSGCNTKPNGTLPANASWSCNPSLTATVSNGANCTAACTSNYVDNAGIWSATCNNSAWLPSSGNLVCTPKPCNSSQLPTVSNPAIRTCTDGSAHGSICTDTCVASYVSTSTLTSTCSFGNWGAVGGSPNCQPIACTFANLSATFPQASLLCTASDYAAGSPCEAACGNSQASFICNATGTWSLFTGLCPADGCVSPPVNALPANAVWNCSTAASGSSCPAVCSSGYTATGSFAAACSNAVWTPAGNLSCSANPCSNSTGLPSLPAAAVWNCPASTPSGGSCPSSCKPGYTTCYTAPVPQVEISIASDGTAPGDTTTPGVTVSATCTSTPQAAQCFAGQWSGPIGGIICNPDPCNSTALPSLPADALWTCPASTPSGGSCIANSCGPGYTATGSRSINCTTGQWGNPTGSISCTLTSSACNNLTALPGLPANAVWNCSRVAANGSNCVGSCETGYSASGSAAVTCAVNGSAGAWSSITGTIACSPNPCNRSTLPPLPSNAAWNCPNITASGGSCSSTCDPGYNATGLVNATCRASSWTFSGPSFVCNRVSCLPSAIPSLSGANAAWPTNCSTGSALLPAGTTCTASCATGYVPVAAGLPTTSCLSGGTWRNVTGGCALAGCTGNPQGTIVPNATWSCSATTPQGGTCNGTCISGDVTNPPVALCDNRQWTYLQGACQPGSKVRYMTIEAEQEFIAEFLKYLANGTALEWLNEHIEETKGSYGNYVPDIILAYINGSLAVDSAWPVNASQFVTTKRRQLLAEQGKETLTIGFQLAGALNGGWLGSVVDTAIDKLLQSQVVLVGLTGFIVRQAEILQKPSPGYNYSTVSIGWSDPLGTIDNPVIPVDCNLFMDVNVSVYDPMCYRDKDSLSPAVQARISQPKFTVCPGKKELKATFPFVAPAPKNIGGQVRFVAVAKRPGVIDGSVISGISCSTSPDTLPSSAADKSQSTTIDVVCVKKNGKPFTRASSFTILLQAYFSCNSANLSSIAWVETTVAARAVLTAKAQPPASICKAKRVAIARFNYTLSGTVNGDKPIVPKGTASSPNNANATCKVTIVPTKGSTSNTGVAIVRCGGDFSKKQAVGMKLTLTAQQDSCLPSRRIAYASVPVVRC